MKEGDAGNGSAIDEPYGSKNIPTRSLFSRGTSSPEPPYTLARGDPQRPTPLAWLTRYRSFAMKRGEC